MATNSSLECKACLEVYDEDKLRPRTLPCGHTICSSCIANWQKENTVTCPTCRTAHKATHPTQFPINFLVEELIADKIAPRHTVSTATVKLPKSGSGKLSKSVQILVEQQRGRLNSVNLLHQETEDELTVYRDNLEDWLEEHQQLSVKLKSLIDQNTSVMDKLAKEKCELEDVLKADNKSQKSQREGLMNNLATVSTTQEAIASIDEAEASNTMTEEWINTCQSSFPDIVVVHRSHQMRDAMRKTLAGVDTVIKDSEAVSVYLKDPSSASIMEKVGHVTTGTLQSSQHDQVSAEGKKKSLDTETTAEKITVTLSVDHLQPLEGHVKKLVMTGQVVAVRKDQYGQRCARLTYLDDGSLHLHALLDQPIPTYAQTIEHVVVMRLVDSFSPVVFLELGWEQSYPQNVHIRLQPHRVYIRLRPKSDFARHFMLLCTGELGPSYKNSHFLQVSNRGWNGECVRGGDYQQDTGQGGARLTKGPGFDGDNISPVAGDVFGDESPSFATGAQFTIMTSAPLHHGLSFNRAIGKVERGLDKVVNAIRSKYNIKEVTVVDCGVVATL